MFIHRIILVPDSCSETFQRLIESLFITHAETKLNMIGHLDMTGIPTTTEFDERGLWCEHLRRFRH